MLRMIMVLYLLPRLLRVVISGVVGFSMFMTVWMFTAISSLWIGVPQATHRIADEWIDRATALGIPNIWNEELYYIIRVVAFLTIVVGWILLSFVTVWIVELIL